MSTPNPTPIRTSKRSNQKLSTPTQTTSSLDSINAPLDAMAKQYTTPPNMPNTPQNLTSAEQEQEQEQNQEQQEPTAPLPITPSLKQCRQAHSRMVLAQAQQHPLPPSPPTLSPTEKSGFPSELSLNDLHHQAISTSPHNPVSEKENGEEIRPIVERMREFQAEQQNQALGEMGMEQTEGQKREIEAKDDDERIHVMKQRLREMEAEGQGSHPRRRHRRLQNGEGLVQSAIEHSDGMREWFNGAARPDRQDRPQQSTGTESETASAQKDSGDGEAKQKKKVEQYRTEIANLENEVVVVNMPRDQVIMGLALTAFVSFLAGALAMLIAIVCFVK